MIDHTAPEMAPGCYGRAMSYRSGTPECDLCPLATSCAPLSIARTQAIRARLGIVAKPPKPPVVSKMPEPAAAIAYRQAMGMSLPVKVIDLLGRIERSGIRVTETLARGENPFTETPAFMRVICHLLLRRPQGLNRRTITMALMHQFKWQETTATPHTTQAIQALAALGAIRDQDGIVSLKS